ncbi:hypothetical protein ACHAXR_013150 [Thalassiosira sp. AJA248-18]
MNSILNVARPRCPLIKRRPLEALFQNHRHIGGSTSTSSSDTASKASDDAIAADGTTAGARSTLAAQCVQPRPIFPWRSSPYPLERLTIPVKPTTNSISNNDDTDNQDGMEQDNARLEEYYASDYFTKGGPLGPGWVSPMEPWFRGVLYANSMHLLGVSWPTILIPWTRKHWVDDMEWNFCNAFSSGVSGMIEDTYILPENDDSSNKKEEKDDQGDESGAFDVNLDITLDPLPLAKKNGEDTSEINKGEGPHNNSKCADINEEDEEYSMLQSNLRQLYQSARQHSHPSKVNIVLRTVPQSAQIESMFPVLGLSRKLVDDHPNLRHTYRNLMRGLERQSKEAVLAGRKRLNPMEVGKFTMKGLLNAMERSANLSGDGNARITVVAQVSIHCKEIFCVRDVESGEIIQGYDDGQPRDVTHLVRFEMVVREKLVDADSPDDGNWEMKIGRWQITDWDDLLDGNVFFT